MCEQFNNSNINGVCLLEFFFTSNSEDKRYSIISDTNNITIPFITSKVKSPHHISEQAYMLNYISNQELWVCVGLSSFTPFNNRYICKINCPKMTTDSESLNNTNTLIYTE